MKNNKIVFIFIIILMLTLILFFNNESKENNSMLDEVKLSKNTKINNKNLAIMVEKEDGSGYEESDTFPEGMALNTSISGCIDKNGDTIDGSIEYNVETMNLKLKSKGSSYCYLYFIRDNEGPILTINIKNNNFTTARLLVTTDENATYCINTSNTPEDMSNCLDEGDLTVNKQSKTSVFSSGGTYYVHAKDEYGNISISEALNVKVLYQIVEYIESSGNQYINTGFIPDNNSRIVLDYENSGTSLAALYGGRTNTTSKVFGMWLEPSTVYPHYGNASYDDIPISIDTTNRLTYDMNKNAITVGTQTTTATSATFDSGYALTLLGLNSGGTVDSRRASGKLYSVQIYDDGTLARDMIPVYRLSDNVIGLFDKVNEVFYTNSGSGTFTKGNDINPDAPVVTVSSLENNTENPKIVFTSSKEGTYCVNTSSIRTDMTNCIYEGNTVTNEAITTNVLTSSGTYYVHIKDVDGNIGISAEIKIMKGYPLGQYIIDNNISGLQKTLIGTDTLYRFSGTSGNTGINNYICLGTTSKCSTGSANMYRIIGVEPETGYVKVINTGSYGNSAINSTTSKPTWANSTLYSTLNGTWYNNLSFRDLIQEHTWNVGAVSSTSYATNRSTVLNYEDNTTIKANIGMFSLSDYYLAYNGDRNWNSNYSVFANNWIHASRIWMMTYASSSAGYWILDATGQVRITTGVSVTDVAVRPTFFLKNTVIWKSGSGTSDDPFIVSYN